MAVNSVRWSRDVSYRAQVVQGLAEDLGEALSGDGWSVLPPPAGCGDSDRAAGARLERWGTDEQIHVRVDAAAKTAMVCLLTGAAASQAWSFETALTSPADKIAQAIREQCGPSANE